MMLYRILQQLMWLLLGVYVSATSVLMTIVATSFQFDVCFDPDNPCRCVLYERYDDRDAFEVHLASDHFREFDAKVQPWVQSKIVETWEQVPLANG